MPLVNPMSTHFTHPYTLHQIDRTSLSKRTFGGPVKQRSALGKVLFALGPELPWSTAKYIYSQGKKAMSYLGKRKAGKVTQPSSKIGKTVYTRTSRMAKRNRSAIFKKSMANPRTGGFLGVELKYKDTSLVSSALTAPTDASGAEHDPTTLLALNAIAQGTGAQERDGKQVCIKSCYVSGVVDVPVLANQTAGSVSPVVYVALVLDKQTNAAQLSSEQVFTNPGASAVTAANPLRNLEFTSRFQVLDSVVLEPPQRNISYDGTNIESLGTRMPFKLSSAADIITNYVAATAVIGSIQDTSLHIIAYTASATGATISYNARVRFVG